MLGGQMRLNHTILRDVGKLARAIKTSNDIRFKDLELHRNQYIFLTRICENKGLTPKELSILLRTDKTTTTKAVQKLIANGYVNKTNDENDARKIRLFPSKKADEAYTHIIREENEILEHCFSDFSEDEIAIVHELIERMNNNYKKQWFLGKNIKE
jgi:DNA-binding MarR family transcriptional regulator